MQINQTSFDYTSTSVKLTVQSGTKAATSAPTDQAADSKSEVDAYQPSGSTSNASAVEQMKADLETHKWQLIDMVKKMLAKQGVQITADQGAWKLSSGESFQVDAETQEAAQAAIADDGYWGVPQTSQRIVDFAKALTGGDSSKVGMMRDAVIQGFEEAKKAWGGELPEITQRTYDAVMKLFDEWENGTEGAETPAQSGGVSGGSTSITIEYERTAISARSLSVTANEQDAGQLTRSGIFSSLSEPLEFNGLTLNSAWCLNEKVSVTVTVGGGAQDAQRPALGDRQDGFVPSQDRLRGTYGPDGKRVEQHWPHPHDAGDHRAPHRNESGEMQIDLYKPMGLDSGGQKSIRVGDEDIPLHEDGTVTVGLPDGTMRRATVNPQVLNSSVRHSQQ